MQTNTVGRAMLIAVESERAAEAFAIAARHARKPGRKQKYHKAARTLREQADAIRLSA